MDQVKIGSFLKELRKERNLTQESLAEKLNVSNRTISRYKTMSTKKRTHGFGVVSKTESIPSYHPDFRRFILCLDKSRRCWKMFG